MERHKFLQKYVSVFSEVTHNSTALPQVLKVVWSAVGALGFSDCHNLSL